MISALLCDCFKIIFEYIIINIGKLSFMLDKQGLSGIYGIP